MEITDYIDKDSWEGFCELRKAMGKRAPFTERAKFLILKKLACMHAAGHDVNAVLDDSTEKGYRGVFEPKPTKPTQQFKTAKQKDAEEAAARVYRMTGGLLGAQQNVIDMEDRHAAYAPSAPRIARH